MFPKVLKKFCGFCCGEGCWPFRRWRHPLNSTPARSCEIRTIRIRTTRIIRTICSAATRSRRRTARNNPPCRPIRPRKADSKASRILFFNDSIRALPNFSWTISRDYNQVHINPLDTTLATFRIDYPFYKEGVGHAAVGALGQASLPYNYFERPQYRDFSFAEGFDVYTYRMENVPFYNLNGRIFTSCTLSLDRRSSGRRISA